MPGRFCVTYFLISIYCSRLLNYITNSKYFNLFSSVVISFINFYFADVCILIGIAQNCIIIMIDLPFAYMLYCILYPANVPCFLHLNILIYDLKFNQ